MDLFHSVYEESRIVMKRSAKNLLHVCFEKKIAIRLSYMYHIIYVNVWNRIFDN